MPKIKGWDKINKYEWINYRYYSKSPDEVKIAIEPIYSRIDKKEYYLVVRYKKHWNETYNYAKRKELKRFSTLKEAVMYAYKWVKRHPKG